MTAPTANNSFVRRAAHTTWLSLTLGSRTGVSTLYTLLKVMVPIMILMAGLEALNVLSALGGFFQPVMGLLGLPGNAALVFVSSATLGLYSAISIAANISLTVKQMTVLAILCLDCHNLPVECAVQRQAGNGVLSMLAVRFFTGLFGALVFFLLIPDGGSWAQPAQSSIGQTVQSTATGWDLFRVRLVENGYVLVKVVVIVMALMILVELLRQTGALKLLTWLMRPLVWLAGLPREAAVTVMASSAIGLAYGAGLVIAESKQGRFTRDERFRTNVFIGTTHSLLEDTGLFAVVGASIGWIVLGRLAIGAVAVRIFAFVRSTYLRFYPSRDPSSTA